MKPTQSAVIVAVPEAEQIVGAARAELDRSAAWGVPAHVTVLFPFLHPEQIDDATVSKLREAIGEVPAFDVVFERIEWFGEIVTWLAPEPDAPFRALTESVWSRFPDHPPYDGAFADTTPHLTIGHDAPAAVLRAAAESVRRQLPVRARVSSALLIQGSDRPASWSPVAELALGDGASIPPQGRERF